MPESYIENPDEESVIMGRTQAVEFVGKLSARWREMAKQCANKGMNKEAYVFEECAEMLESKIEDFANC